MTQRPLLAVTMGDPAGIGPEIAVRALLSPEVRALARCFIIGDGRVLVAVNTLCLVGHVQCATAARVLGCDADRAIVGVTTL